MHFKLQCATPLAQVVMVLLMYTVATGWAHACKYYDLNYKHTHTQVAHGDASTYFLVLMRTQRFSAHHVHTLFTFAAVHA